MKSGILIVLMLVVGCSKPDICKDSGSNHISIGGIVRFDERFDRYVIDDFQEGSIDSRDIYILCDPSSIADIEDFMGQYVTIAGWAHTPDQDLTPLAVVAGEEFFVFSSVDSFALRNQ